MSHIFVVDHDGREHRIAGRPGWKVMEMIRDAGLEIRAECGGCCACATCHVYVHPDWLGRLPPRGEDEEDTLDLAAVVEDNSRLSCQIEYTDALSGLTVTLSQDTA
jgi:2Fe-2S ferredoxin